MLLLEWFFQSMLDYGVDCLIKREASFNHDLESLITCCSLLLIHCFSDNFFSMYASLGSYLAGLQRSDREFWGVRLLCFPLVLSRVKQNSSFWKVDHAAAFSMFFVWRAPCQLCMHLPVGALRQRQNCSCYFLWPITRLRGKKQDEHILLSFVCHLQVPFLAMCLPPISWVCLHKALLCQTNTFYICFYSFWGLEKRGENEKRAASRGACHCCLTQWGLC